MADEILSVLAASEQPDTVSAKIYAWPHELHSGKTICIEGSQRVIDTCEAWRRQGRIIPEPNH